MAHEFSKGNEEQRRAAARSARAEGEEEQARKSGSSKPRPGNRDTDPSRDNRGGGSSGEIQSR